MTWHRARNGIFWAIALSSATLALVAIANWITSIRNGTGVAYWELDTRIPFVNWMLVPYFLAAGFFLAAPLLCRNRDELHALVKRVCFVLLVSACCFLLIPLEFGGDDAPRWLDPLRRFNPFPSLHFALCAVIAPVYIALVGRAIVWPVLALMAVASLLARQHHVIDLLGAGLLALFTYYQFPDLEPPRVPAGHRPGRLSAWRAAGSLFFFAMAFLLWPYGAILLWPATAYALAAFAYAGLGPALFRKTGGRMSAPARALLAPVLVWERMSLPYIRKRSKPWSQAAPGVFYGRLLADPERLPEGVHAVLDLTAEFSEPERLRSLVYCNVPVLEHAVPAMETLEEAVAFVDQQAANGAVYVHCALGFSRSAGVVAAYLLKKGIANNPQHAFRMLRAVRPQVVLSSRWMETLRLYRQRLAARPDVALNPANPESSSRR